MNDSTGSIPVNLDVEYNREIVIDDNNFNFVTVTVIIFLLTVANKSL